MADFGSENESAESLRHVQQVSRRHALEIGGLGLLGVSLPQFLQLQATRAGQLPGQQIKSCIVIFYYGGPSHLDTFDMKPNAPSEVRGEFRSIATSVPGLQISEHLPHTAKIMHKVTVVRSMHHDMRGHDSASYQALTGHVPPMGDNQNFGERPDSFPCYGACLNRVRPHFPVAIPHASLPFVMNNNFINPGQTSGFLGPAYQPLLIQGEPDSLTYSAGSLELLRGVNKDRFQHRMKLFRALNSSRRSFVDDVPMSVFSERAFELIVSSGVRDALDINQETLATRERYGTGEAGQPYDDDPKSRANVELAIARNMRGINLLMARRLVEAGVPFVNVYDYKQQGKNWDTHADNFTRHKDHLLPQADQAFAALIEDLDQRGLLDTTLVVAMGEFGRTPRINKDAGRDHWPDCYTALLAGGPIKGGYLHGASDKIGAYPAKDPVTPADLAATIFSLFGVDPRTLIHDSGGRPYPIALGRPIEGLTV